MLNKILNKYMRRSSKELDFLKVFKFLRVNNIQGSYLEFGVYNGKSLNIAYQLSKESRYTFTSFIGYDTFEGIPKPNGVDKGFIFNGGEFIPDIDKLKRNIRKIHRLKLVKGLYKDTLPLYLYKASCIHIDCDYFESTQDIFNNIKPYLQVGTVIIFDDWYIYNSDKNKGVRLAFEKFKSKNKNLLFEEMSCIDLQKIFIVGFKT